MTKILNKKAIPALILIMELVLSGFYLNLPRSSGATVNTAIIISAAYCNQLAAQQGATVNANSGSCTFTGSSTHSPMFLTNSTTALTIPSGFSLTMSSTSFQFASYGNITNSGTITIAASGSLVLYGIFTNSGTTTITGNLVVVNTTDMIGLTSFINTAGHTVTVTGRIYNVAQISNAGTFINAGNNFFDCISGLSYPGTFTNTGTFNGGVIKTTC